MVKDKTIVEYMELVTRCDILEKLKILQDKERETYKLLDGLDEKLKMEIEVAIMDSLELTRHCYLELGVIKSELDDNSPDYDVFKRCKTS